MLARSVTSQRNAAPPTLPATSWSGSSRRPSSETFAPAAWSCSAVAAPIPVPPPVISAWRPSSRSVSHRSPLSIRALAKAPTVARRRRIHRGKRLMKTRAAVAFEAKKPLEIVELDLEGPKAGEVLVEIMATGICHTDAYTLDGLDSEGMFPSILGHEGAGVVREVGAGRHQRRAGRPRHPACTRPNAASVKSCLTRQDQPVHRDPRHARQGPDARRHQPLQLQGRDDLPLHGLLDLLELHRAARDRGCENPRGRAVRQGLLHRLRRHHRRRRGDQDRQGPAGRQCRRVRPGRDRPQRHPGREAGRREHRSSASTSTPTARNGAASSA